VELDLNARLIADNNHQPWPVYNLAEPIVARSNAQHSILNKIQKIDNAFWKSEYALNSDRSDFEDSIELTFVNPEKANQGSLVIRAINTYFANMVFEKVVEFLDEQTLPFMQAAENDPEMIRLLEEWTIESSIKVSVWNGITWQPVGIIYPEANVIPFTRLVRITQPDTQNDTVRIKLSMLADNWHIDAIGIDWTEVKKLNKNSTQLLSISGTLSEADRTKIDKRDNSYAILLPAQYTDLTFASLNPCPGKKICYGLDVGGYLYEWLPERNDQSAFATLGEIYGENRIGFIKYLMRHRSLLLPPLYDEWKNGGNKRYGP
jgi:hypothetical protein